MSKSITVPILKDKFNTNEQIGTLTILKDSLPQNPNFVFTIAYRFDDTVGEKSYELKEVAIVSDSEFIAYLKEQGKL